MLLRKFIVITLVLVGSAFWSSCSNTTNNPGNDEDPDHIENDKDEESDDDEDITSDLFGNTVLNPSGHAPLTAEIEFTAESAGEMEVKIISPDENEEDFTYSFMIEESGLYTIPVLGLYPDNENKIFFSFTDSSKHTVSHTAKILTAPLPLDFPKVTASGYYEGNDFTYAVYVRTKLDEDLEGIYGGGRVNYLSNIIGIAFDKWGNVRWYSTFPQEYFFPMEIIDGEIFGADWITDFEYAFSFDFMGNKVKEIHLAEIGFAGIHHDIIKTNTGNYILTSDEIDKFILEDQIIEIDGETFELVREWDLKETIPEVPDLFRDIPVSGDPDFTYSNDPIHVNGTWHDENDDSIIVTMQRTGMAKIASDGTLKWFLFPHIVKYLDDEDGNNISDSLEARYDIEDMDTWIGDFKSNEDPLSLNENYIHHRKPIAGEPEEGTYPFDFHYGHFLLKPLDSSGNEITEEKYVMGFVDHDEFKWAYRPHTPVILKNGNIMLFDNGLARNFEPSPDFSRAVEYEIIEDESGYGGTARQIWEYIVREDNPLQGWSVVVSGVYELENGNRVITSGSLASAMLPDLFFMIYGDGPIGAYIVEVDPATDTDMHSLLIERYIDDDHPNSAFSVYRSKRVNIASGISPVKKQ